MPTNPFSDANSKVYYLTLALNWYIEALLYTLLHKMEISIVMCWKIFDSILSFPSCRCICFHPMCSIKCVVGLSKYSLCKINALSIEKLYQGFKVSGNTPKIYYQWKSEMGLKDMYRLPFVIRFIWNNLCNPYITKNVSSAHLVTYWLCLK